MISGKTIIDLTYVLNKSTPNWFNGCGFHLTNEIDYHDTSMPEKYGELPEPMDEIGFRIQEVKMHAGIGTHMDAPCHIIEGGKTIDQLLLKNLVTPCVKIDVSKKAGESYLISPDDIKAFEDTYGRIPENSLVIFYTGWDRFWNDPDKYHNNMSFPSVSVDVSEIMLERDVAGIGIDTLSPDLPGTDFMVHKNILGAGKYIIENVANAKLLPAAGALSFALPINIQDGTEAPIRLIAIA